jgi:hypothetical protein
VTSAKQMGAAVEHAEQKIDNAQAEADRKIAEAQASFTKLREDYRHDTTIALADLDQKIADLAARDEKAVGQSKTDLDAKLPKIHADRDAFVADYKALDTAVATTWDGVRARLDKEFDALKSLVART